MVLRYWGMTGVRPTDFDLLVSEERGGMRAGDLAARIRYLGWEAYLFPGRFEEVRRHVRLGRPVITLIEVGEERYHFVVIVGEAGDRLVLHDPADAPFRLVGRAELEEAWEATGALSLLVVPRPGRGPNVRPAAGEPKRTEQAQAGEAPVAAGDAAVRAPRPGLLPPLPASCRRRLTRALGAASDDRLGDAAALLATGACRDEAVFLTELAGVRLRQGRPAEAAALARRALAADPHADHAARTLATSLYVNDEHAAALDAWNRVGEPVVDLIRIPGLDRVAYRPARRILGLRGGQLLTPRSRRLAARRLADLPAASATRVTYVPTGGGRADVVAALAERPGLPTAPLPLAITGLRAAIYREIFLTAVSPLGRGETWSAGWRWWENRPAVSFRFAGPAEFGPPAIWSLTAGREEEAYALPMPGLPSPEGPTPAFPTRAERTGVALASSAWLLPDIRTELRAGFERWEAAGGHVRWGVTGEWRAPGDRLRLAVELDRWASLDGGPHFGRAAVRADAATRTAREGLVLSGRAYLRTAGEGAPPTLWPGAGIGIARPNLLRAHTLLDDGVITGRAFDRHLAGAGVELVHWFAPELPLRIGAAAFVDAAHTWGERRGNSLVDAGLGLRLAGATGGPVLRFDVATSLSDDEWAISAGWSSADMGR